MKSFSITRIPDNDLIGLLFPPLTSFSEYEIEVIHPEYVDDAHVGTNGSVSPTTGAAYSVTDVSKYDFILLPLVTNYQGAYDISGMNNTGIGSAITQRSVQLRVGSGSDLGTVYTLLKVDSNYSMAIVNSRKGYYLPIIGFKRHRSDNVNPRSPQRPELEPIEIRERQESEPEPVPEIAEPDVEETPEEVEEE